MSYRPGSPSALAAFDLLVEEDRPWPHYVYPSDIHVHALRELLIALVCPIPCNGVRGGEDWHLLCENKADSALMALGF